MAQILILQEGHYEARKNNPDGKPWETLVEWIPVFIVDWNQNIYGEHSEATIVLKKPFKFYRTKFESPAGTIMKVTASQGGQYGGVYLTIDVGKINARTY